MIDFRPKIILFIRIKDFFGLEGEELTADFIDKLFFERAREVISTQSVSHIL